MDGQAQLLLILLVASAGWPFSVGSLARRADDDLHPVVLLPGYGCSQLDARLTDEFEPASVAPSCGGALNGKKGGWFRLWNNRTALQEDPALVPCYAELLRLVFDPVAGDYRNVPGVETRVVSFGTTLGFGSVSNPCTGGIIDQPISSPRPRRELKPNKRVCGVEWRT